MTEKTNQARVIASGKTVVRFWTLGLAVIVVIPLFLIAIYELLGGGVLNGLAGSWRQSLIDPDLLLLVLNPVLMVSAYLLLCFQFKSYVQRNKRNYLKLLFSIVLMILSTLSVTVVVFWKAITT